MALLKLNKPPFSYTKIHFEDPDELQHRRAQFIIYKVLQKADDTASKRPSWLRVRACRLKMKIGKRLRRLRKRYSCTLLSTKSDFCKKITFVLRSCKHLIHGKKGLGSENV